MKMNPKSPRKKTTDSIGFKCVGNRKSAQDGNLKEDLYWRSEMQTEAHVQRMDKHIACGINILIQACITYVTWIKITGN